MGANCGPETGDRIAKSILQYLLAKPKSADTLTGITRWWLLQQRIEQTTAEVAQALATLKNRRLVEELLMPDGQVLYKARVPSHLSNGATEKTR